MNFFNYTGPTAAAPKTPQGNTNKHLYLYVQDEALHARILEAVKNATPAGQRPNVSAFMCAAARFALNHMGPPEQEGPPLRFPVQGDGQGPA